MEESITFEAFNVPSFHGITLIIIQLSQVKGKYKKSMEGLHTYPVKRNQLLRTIKKEITVGVIKSTAVPYCTLIIYKGLSFWVCPWEIGYIL